MELRVALKRMARPLLAGVCVTGGWGSYQAPKQRADMVEQAGLPKPDVLVKVNAVAMMVAGGALALGIRPREAAAALVGCLVPTTVVGHPYWKEEDAGARTRQEIQFAKNISTIGGLLYVIADSW
jgi:putative oxidoreductase